MGKLIVIEGLDGSGKATQTNILFERLQAKNINIKKVTFPDYESLSSGPVRLYLNGELGEKPDDVNAYAASAFYAADRYCSFVKNWKKDFVGGAVILCDRYATSNAIYQLSKIPDEKKNEFLLWLEDFEYIKLEIPKPDLVIYLDVPIEVSQELLSKRYKGDQSKKDIHENNLSFLKECRKSAIFAADKLNWKIISCAENGKMLNIDKISDKIEKITREFI